MQTLAETVSGGRLRFVLVVLHIMAGICARYLRRLYRVYCPYLQKLELTWLTNFWPSRVFCLHLRCKDKP